MAKNIRQVVGGVDTHADAHVIAVLDEVGRVVGTAQFPTGRQGHAALLRWLRRHGQVRAVGVEGTGSYGAGLARALSAAGIAVVEVNRPDRAARRAQGKSDPVDAEAAARAVLAGTATAVPKARDGQVEAIRVLRLVRSSAVKARTAALNSLLATARSAVEPVAGALHGLPARQLVRRLLATDRPTPTWSSKRTSPAADSHAATASAAGAGSAADGSVAETATRLALRRLAERVAQLDEEIAAADRDLHALTARVAPGLLSRRGVGPDVAGQLLTTAGDNPRRLTDHNSFALLTGVAPREASSGRTVRHRLNRGGDRQANKALHTVVLSRMSHDPRTRAYVARRLTEGKNKKEIIRCLKRYVARELFPLIIEALSPTDPQAPPPPPLAATA